MYPTLYFFLAFFQSYLSLAHILAPFYEFQSNSTLKSLDAVGYVIQACRGILVSVVYMVQLGYYNKALQEQTLLSSSYHYEISVKSKQTI